jgi:uncharacterized protein (DUF1810 family)
LAQKFAISSKEEAEAYLGHPVLGLRLRELTQLVNSLEGRSIEQIFGSPDDMKFRSSMTLFAHATADNQVFIDALRKYCNGKFDPLTLGRLQLSARCSHSKQGRPLEAVERGRSPAAVEFF